MRVLETVQSYFPFQERGGSVFKVRAIARRLARRGHQVTVLTADLGISELRGAETPRFQRSEWGWRLEEDGVETVFLRTFAHYRALTINPPVIGFCGVSLSRFDLVHFYGLYDLLGPVVSHYSRRQGIPYVIEPIGMYRPIVRSFALKRAYHRFLGRRFVTGARFVIATSEQEAQELATAGIDSSRIAIRRNGIDPPESFPECGEFRRHWKIGEDAKIILFLGRVVSKKRPDLLLQSFAAWRAQSGAGQNSILVIAGPHERDGYLRRLQGLAQTLGVSDRVLFPGPLYDRDKWQAYVDADVFVLPSQNENFGNTAAEAAACGTPIIVTNCCGIAPFVGSAGLVVSPQTEELQGALARILHDEEFRDQCKSGCRRMVDRLSWDAPLTTLEQLYERCVSSRLPHEDVA